MTLKLMYRFNGLVWLFLKAAVLVITDFTSFPSPSPPFRNRDIIYTNNLVIVHRILGIRMKGFSRMLRTSYKL